MLALEGLVKRFGRGTAAEVTALDAVSLEVSAGEFVTLIGSNGAGKSTLLRTVLGTVAPDRGRVVLDGRDVTRDPVHRRAHDIGRIAQDPGESTCAGMTVEENLAMAVQRGRAGGSAGASRPRGARCFALGWPRWVSAWRAGSAPGSARSRAGSARRWAC